MAKLVFNYASMNSGKTTRLLQVFHSYQSSGKNVLCLIPDIKTRFGEQSHIIKSRIHGMIECPAVVIGKEDDLLEPEFIHDNKIDTDYYDIILVDEVQFLSTEQVKQLATIVDIYNVTVLAYGLRTDFQGNLFEGSEAMFKLADVFDEVKGVCSHPHCTKRSTHVLRMNEFNEVVKTGQQIAIGAEETYRSVCRSHFFEHH